jgi:hypothetical protein
MYLVYGGSLCLEPQKPQFELPVARESFSIQVRLRLSGEIVVSRIL